MIRNKATRILLTTIWGTIICFCLFYWVLQYTWGKALWLSVAINFLMAFINYIATKRFNKDNKRQ